MESYLRKRGFRLTLLIGVVFCSLGGIYLLRDIFAPLILGFLLAYVLDPLADALERIRIGPFQGRRLTAVVIIFGIAAFLGAITLFTGAYYLQRGIDQLFVAFQGERPYEVRREAEAAAGSAPVLGMQGFYIDRGNQGYQGPPHETLHLSREAAEREAESRDDDEFPKEAQPAASTIAKQPLYYVDLNGNRERDIGYVEKIKNLVQGWEAEYGLARAIRETIEQNTEDNGVLDPQRLRKDAHRWVAALWEFRETAGDAAGAQKPRGGIPVFALISYLVFCPLYTFFFLLEIDTMVAAIRRYLPGRHRPQIERIFSQIDRTLASFLRGRLMICLIKSAIAATGLWLLGVDYAILLGLMAGFLSLVPYVGIYFSMLPALLLCWLEHGSVGRIIGVLGLYGLNEGLEGFVLVPQVLGKEIGLHPLTVIVTLLIFAKIFGFLGLLLSVPLAAISKILGKEFILPLILEFAAEDPHPPEAPT